MAKSDYMLAIVWLLRSRGRMTANQLADNLEISVRSVYRYVDSLCASGVPIIAEPGHDGGYRLLSNYLTVPLFFTSEEKAALSHATLFAKNAGYPFTEALDSSLQKIQFESTTEQVEDLLLHAGCIDVLATTNHSAYTVLLADLEKSIAYGQTVQISYKKPGSNNLVERDVNPYGLVHWRDRWYIVGYCHLRQGVRTFRVDRIRDYSLTTALFVKTDKFSAGEFFLQQRLASNSETDSLSEVILSGDETALQNLANHWLLRSRIVMKNETQIQLLVEQPIFEKILPNILLSFGHSLQIIEPNSLRARMVALIEELHQHYLGFTDRTCQ